MTWHTITDGDNGTANIIMDCLLHAGRLGFSSFYPMHGTTGAYLVQDMGETGKEWGDVYLALGKNIYIGGVPFRGGGSSSNINIAEIICSLKKSGIDSAINCENLTARAFTEANALTLTLGKSYTTADTTSIYLDQNAVLINALTANGDWTAGTGTPTLSDNTTAGQFVEGTGSVKMTKTNLNGAVDMYKASLLVNMVNKNARLWCYLDTVTNVTKVSVVFESSAGNSKTFDFLVAGLIVGLNHLHCDFDLVDGTASNITITTAGTFVASGITKIYLGYTTGSAQTVNCSFDFLRTIDKWDIINSLHKGFCVPIYDASNKQDIYITAESAYPAKGLYTVSATLSNNYALGTFASTATFAKLNSGTINLSSKTGTFSSSLGGAVALSQDFIDRQFLPKAVTEKTLSLSAQFITEAYPIYDFTSTTALRIYNTAGALDISGRFKSGDKVVMFKYQNSYNKYQSYYNSTLLQNFKILTLTTDSTYSAPYTTLTDTNSSNATGGETADWYIIRLSVFLKYFVGTLTSNEIYTTLTPTTFIAKKTNNRIFFDNFDRVEGAPAPSTNDWVTYGDYIRGSSLYNGRIWSESVNSPMITSSVRSVENYTGDKEIEITLDYTWSYNTGTSNDNGFGIKIASDATQGTFMGASQSRLCTGFGIVFNSIKAASLVDNLEIYDANTLLASSSTGLLGRGGVGTVIDAYVKIQICKRYVRAKIWSKTSNEPTAWQVEYNFTSVGSVPSNKFVISLWQINGNSYLTQTIDNLEIKEVGEAFVIGGEISDLSGEKMCVRANLTRSDSTNDLSSIIKFAGILT